MKKLLLGLAVTLPATVAICVPALAQTLGEQTPQSQTDPLQRELSSSTQQHDDAAQTTRSSQETSAPGQTPPAPPPGSQPGQAQQAQPSETEPGTQQSVLRQPGQQQPGLQQSGPPQPAQQQQPGQQQTGQQQFGLQQPEPLPDQQQLGQQQPGSQQPDQQQQNQRQLNQLQSDQQIGIEFQQSNQIAGRGLAISSIQPNSVFFNSGLRQGDVLLSVDNRPILNQAEFVRIIREFPEPRIPLLVLRGGRRETIFVNRPVQFGMAVQQQSAQRSQAILGVSFDPQFSNAAIVRSVTIGGPADQAGLRTGDQITALNGQMVSSPQDAVRIISAMSAGQQVTIDYARQQMNLQAQAVLVPRSGERVEYRVGYAPAPETQVITPVPIPRQTYYYWPNRRVEYYYNDWRPRRMARRGWYRY